MFCLDVVRYRSVDSFWSELRLPPFYRFSRAAASPPFPLPAAGCCSCLSGLSSGAWCLPVPFPAAWMPGLLRCFLCVACSLLDLPRILPGTSRSAWTWTCEPACRRPRCCDYLISSSRSAVCSHHMGGCGGLGSCLVFAVPACLLEVLQGLRRRLGAGFDGDLKVTLQFCRLPAFSTRFGDAALGACYTGGCLHHAWLLPAWEAIRRCLLHLLFPMPMPYHCLPFYWEVTFFSGLSQ